MIKYLKLCFILGIIALLASCQTDKVANLENNSNIPPEVQFGIMTKAVSLMHENKLDEAQKILKPLEEEPAYPAKFDAVMRKLKVLQFEKDQSDSVTQAMHEADERLVFPDSYGKTVSITGEDITPNIPVGRMEDVVSKKVSMDLRDAGLKDVIMALSKLNGVNIIADSALTSDEQITVKVKEVPLKNVLSYIARNMGITFHIGEHMIWVTQASGEENNAPRLETRFFKLRTGVIPKIDGGDDGFSFGGGGGDKGGDGGDAESELADALETFLENGPEGSDYKIYKNRNLLVVKNTRENIRLVEMLLQELDKEILQVSIEARFVTITQKDLKEFGANLSKIQPLDTTTHKDVMTVSNQLLRNFPNSGNLTLSGVIGKWEYEAVLHALDEKSSTRTVSAPRVTVLNNHIAKIRRGDTLRYYEDYDLETVPNQNGVAVSQPVPTGSVQTIDLGVNFEVKPTISNDGRKVMLALKPSVKQFVKFEEFVTAKLPKTNENSIETTVVVDSGQTVVLGGMITETKEHDNDAIPLLGDLPIVGKFFGNESNTTNPSHLIIFVTATIVNSSGEYVNIVD